MQLTRRDALSLGLGATAASFLPLRAMASADDPVAAWIANFTGGTEAGTGGITLTAPEIAENGNTVPVSVEAPGAVAIMVVAPGNPNPGVFQIKFGPLAAEQFVSTRIRLAGTQDVIAIAQMADGSFVQTTRTVKVTIGGCGG